MDYETMKDSAKRKLVDLTLLFERMESERAADALLYPTGELATQSDEMRRKYSLAQMTICGMCGKLMEAAKECIDT